MTLGFPPGVNRRFADKPLTWRVNTSPFEDLSAYAQ
jgi:hypothetical protein